MSHRGFSPKRSIRSDLPDRRMGVSKSPVPSHHQSSKYVPSRYLGPGYAAKIKSKAADHLKDITGRMEKLLNEFETSDWHGRPEDYISNVGSQAESLENSELKANIGFLLHDYTNMCSEREELLTSLQNWFDVCHIEEMPAGTSNDYLREAMESGKEASDRLREVKQRISKLVNLGQSVQEQIAEKKRLEVELLKAKAVADESQVQSNKELNAAMAENDNKIWKTSASEICQMMIGIREDGASEIAEKIESMSQLLEEKSVLIERLRFDGKTQREEIKARNKQILDYETALFQAATEKRSLEDEIQALRRALLEKEEALAIAETAMEDNNEKLEAKQANIIELKKKLHEAKYQMQPNKGRVRKGAPQKKPDLEVQDESSLPCLSKARNSVSEDEAIVDELMEKNKSLKIQLVNTENELHEALAEVEKQNELLADSDMTRRFENEGKLVAEISHLEMQLEDAEERIVELEHVILSNEDDDDTVSANDVRISANGSASERSLRFEEHAQEIQKSVWKQITNRAVIEMTHGMQLRQSFLDEDVRDVLDTSVRGKDVEETKLKEKCVEKTEKDLATEIKEKYLQESEKSSNRERGQGWLFEEIHNSSLRQYIQKTVSRISDVIGRFVQKASALVNAEGTAPVLFAS